MNWDEHSVKKTPWVEININKTKDSCVMGTTGSMGKLEELNYLQHILPYLL